MKKQKIIAAFTAFLMSFGAAQTSNYSPGIFTASAASSAETVSDTSPAVQAADKYTLGDINDDGYIDAVDASSVLSYYAKISTLSDGRFSNRQKMAADYNSDGLINAVDASNILTRYAQLSANKNSQLPEDDIISEYLTPQDFGADGGIEITEDMTEYLSPLDFGAVGNGKKDDTEAFRKLFKAAYDAGPYSDSWRHTKAIYIPSGTYLITGTIIDKDLDVNAAMFEVVGAGRESTSIKFTADVLFDNQMIFGFTTFSGIEFEGNNKNSVMNIKDNGFGVQRLQFSSCSFQHCNKIINCLDSDVMLSEITFSFCKISNCGSESNPCQLFVLNCQQAVNWRFIYTDIESFIGDAFYYTKGASVCIIGGSIIPHAGNVFFFDFNTSDRANSSGESNAPQALCIASRFEIRGTSSLIKTTCIKKNGVKASFKSCNLGTASNTSPNFIVMNGAANILFENCYEVRNIIINGNFSTSGYISPKINFVNCSDVNVDYLAEKSTIVNAISSLGMNNCRITVDDTYDFYLRNNKVSDPNDPRENYFHTVAELHECRQYVKFDESDYVTISNGKTYATKPFGFVKYVELTVPKNETYGNKYPVTLTLYDKGTQIGEPIQLTFGATKIYKIEINDYVEELQAVFTHSLSLDPRIGMNMEIVKL